MTRVNVNFSHREVTCPILTSGGVELPGAAPSGDVFTRRSSGDWIRWVPQVELPILGYRGRGGTTGEDTTKVYSAWVGYLDGAGEWSSFLEGRWPGQSHRDVIERWKEKQVSGAWMLSSTPYGYTEWIDRARITGAAGEVRAIRVLTMYALYLRPGESAGPKTVKESVPPLAPICFKDEGSDYEDAVITWIPGITGLSYARTTSAFVADPVYQDQSLSKEMSGWPHRLSIIENAAVVEVGCDFPQMYTSKMTDVFSIVSTGISPDSDRAFPEDKDQPWSVSVAHPDKGRLEVRVVAPDARNTGRQTVEIAGELAGELRVDPGWYRPSGVPVNAPADWKDVYPVNWVSDSPSFLPHFFLGGSRLRSKWFFCDDDEIQTPWRQHGLDTFSEAIVAGTPETLENVCEGSWSYQNDEEPYDDWAWGKWRCDDDLASASPPWDYRIVWWRDGYRPQDSTAYDVLHTGSTDGTGLATVPPAVLAQMRGKGIVQAQMKHPAQGWWYEWYEEYGYYDKYITCPYAYFDGDSIFKCDGTGLVTTGFFPESNPRSEYINGAYGAWVFDYGLLVSGQPCGELQDFIDANPQAFGCEESCWYEYGVYTCIEDPSIEVICDWDPDQVWAICHYSYVSYLPIQEPCPYCNMYDEWPNYSGVVEVVEAHETLPVTSGVTHVQSPVPPEPLFGPALWRRARWLRFPSQWSQGASNPSFTGQWSDMNMVGRLYVADAYSRPCPVSAYSRGSYGGKPSIAHKAYWFSNVELANVVWGGDWSNWTFTYDDVAERFVSVVMGPGGGHPNASTPVYPLEPEHLDIRGRIDIRVFDLTNQVFLAMHSPPRVISGSSSLNIPIDPEFTKEVLAIATVRWESEDPNRNVYYLTKTRAVQITI